MTTREARGLAATETEEASIASYLQHNPDFFERHQAVLTRLRLPHVRGGSTVSLVERQIEVLREKHSALENKLAELVRVARGNDLIADKLHRFTKRLLRAGSRTAAVDQIEASRARCESGRSEFEVVRDIVRQRQAALRPGAGHAA
jgi:uncharacterized protein YigA (DUF484 family)